MKKWIVKGLFKENSNVLPILLENRGIGTDEKEEFLNPPLISEYLKRMPVDFKKSLKKSREEILNAIAQNQPIIIHGDYDADGICATAILYQTLMQVLNYTKTAYFIPNRFDHGYGLSFDSIKEIDKLVKKKFDVGGGLIITVDCGITAEQKVIDFARSLGFKVIITDHHLKTENDPQVDVLLWSDQMVGAGISLLLSIVLGLRDESLVSLAGIATVTDLAVLKGFNRTLVKNSLEILNKASPLGIKTLLNAIGKSNGAISVYDLGYVIGPRLNASGRLESAYGALELLLEHNEEKALSIAQKLNAVNLERQEMTQSMYELADELITDKSGKIIIVASEKFHEGIIGLVAGKLAQKYYKPVIAISINSDTAKGSVRSVFGINIIEFLRHFESDFESLGGHPMAAGFSVKNDNLPSLIRNLIDYSEEFISDTLLVPKLNIDLEIPLYLINTDLLAQLELLKPYGIGNPEPLFLSRGVSVSGSNFVGKDNAHLSLRLFDGGSSYKAMVFDAKSLGIGDFETGQKIDIVYTANIKEFNGQTSVDLIIKDFSKAD